MSKPLMKIAFCENGAGYGGAVISLEGLLRNTPPNVAPFIYTEQSAMEYRKLSDYGKWIPIHPISIVDGDRLKRNRVPFGSGIDNIFNVLPFALRYYIEFKRRGIDVVYLNNDPSCNLAPALAAWSAGLPTILHARGFTANIKSCRWVLSQVAHCFAVSHSIKNQLLEVGLHHSKCTVVPEGLDLKLFFPRAPFLSLRDELGIPSAAHIITLVAGLVDWKGQDVLLSACPRIFVSYPNTHVLLVGAAYGKDRRFAEEIKAKANSPSFKGRVHLLGTRGDIPEILSISDIVLHASTKPEPFGRTFLEGMAMGRPVIASNEGGPPEVIEHGVDGLLVQPRDPNALADAICSILSNRILAQTLAQNAAIKARKYSIENHSKSIYDTLFRIFM